VLDKSKNIFPTDSTFILAVLVDTIGRLTVSLPSFGVFAINVVGNVFPPSVESLMLTFAQLTGAAFVFATSHVIVCGMFAFKVTAVLGDVTRNGPADAETLYEIYSNPTPPPETLLSLAIKQKDKFLVYVGNISPITCELLSKLESFGNVLVGDVTGVNDLNIGALPTGAFQEPAGPKSYSSQQ
jgi:hypothetical protein